MMKWFLVGLAVVLLSACGGGGKTDTSVSSIKAAKIISVSSASRDSVYVEWLPSVDEHGMDIRYEVHLSTVSNFQSSSSINKLETTEKEASITGLTADTEYFIMVVAKNSQNGIGNSLQLKVKTASMDIKYNDGVNIVVQESSQIVSKDENSVTTTSSMSAGDYIVGDSEHIYLRKVTSVQEQNGKFVAQTEPAAVGEVFSDFEFSTSYKLEDVEDNTQSSSKIVQNTRKSSYSWKSGSSLSSKYFIGKSQPKINRQAKIVISTDIKEEKGSYYKVSSPAIFAVNVGDHLKHKLDISRLEDTYSYNDYGFNNVDECTAVGGTYDYVGQNECLDIPVKICNASYTARDLNDLGSNNLPKVVKSGSDYYIEWTPNSNNVDSVDGGDYLLDVSLDIGIGDCAGANKDRLETGYQTSSRR